MSIVVVPDSRPGTLGKVTTFSVDTIMTQAITPPAGTTVGPATPVIDVVALSSNRAASLTQAGAMHLPSNVYTMPPPGIVPKVSLRTAALAVQANAALSATHVTLPIYVPPTLAGTTQPVSPLALLPRDTTLSGVGTDITNAGTAAAAGTPSAIVNVGSLLAASASKVTVATSAPMTPALSHLNSQSTDPIYKLLNLVT